MSQKKSTSLARETMISMAFRITVVVTIATGASYFHMGQILKTQHLTQLVKYVKERGAREATLFSLAESNHETMRTRLLTEFKSGFQGDVNAEFSKLFVHRPDGSWRDRDATGIDTNTEPTFYHGPQVEMTAELKKRLLIGRQFIKRYAHAYEKQFADTYFTTPENSMFLYWPGSNWGAGAPADLDMRKEEYIWAADSEHNPERKTVWTGMYFDVAVSVWMLSVETPVYDGEKLLATIGHDILLKDILDRAINISLPGTKNIILREDGRLIAHPNYMEQIKQSEGKLVVTDDKGKTNDLKRLFTTLTSKDDEETIHYDSESKAYYGSHFIAGPNWYFVVEYPESLITNQAFEATKFIFGLGIFSLISELVVLFLVIRKRVAQPLQELVAATQKVSDGDFSSRTHLNRSDELGTLNDTFNAMLDSIVDRDKRLVDHAKDLEVKVEERTKSLEAQRAQMVSSAKMASLGEMAGGIAHEINNPLGVIQGFSEYLIELASEETLKSQDVTQAAGKIKVATLRISKIVQGLRAFSRDGSRDRFEMAKVGSIIEETLSLCKIRMHERGIELVLEIPNPDLDISCRMVEISQVLLNLLNNACDALDGCPVKKITLSVREMGDSIVVSVCDTGPGIPADIRDKIMQPFFTTKPVGKGTGLGLSISRNLIEGHGGNLELDTAATGTTFRIVLPHKKIVKAA